ncbi:hypothetical protein EYF80_060338 [Liparis tanakae]|uniref:Uncharacterized protein n=1 Tax=Liparis tanakae TaxID=230148 RepID=A0A4Z2EMC6_9TELE|nr:hypothetical protein EYF80_060338 [Liparis tanakae]
MTGGNQLSGLNEVLDRYESANARHSKHEKEKESSPVNSTSPSRSSKQQNVTKHDYVTKPVSLKPLKPRPLQPLSGGGAAAQSLHSSASPSYTSIVLRKSLPSKPPTATATPALLRGDVMLPSIRHSLRAGSYASTQRSARAPSKPPTTNSFPGEEEEEEEETQR